MKKIAHEEYSLILTHTYVNEDGDRMELEDPVKVVRVFPVEGNRMILPVAVCINDMMDRMKDYILRKAGEVGGKQKGADNVPDE